VSDQPNVSVLVDGRGARPGALDRTVAAVRAGSPGVTQVLVVHGAADATASDAVSFLADPDQPAVAFAHALDAASSPVVVSLPAGIEPSPEWPGAVAESLARRHHAAVSCPVLDPATGRPRPGPSGFSHVGHPLAPLEGAPVVEGPTFFLGPVWAGWADELRRVGGFDPRLADPSRTIDLGWRLWTSSAGIVADPDLAIVGTADTADGATGPPRSAVRNERDALVTLYRNLDDASLGAALPGALVLSPLRLAAADPGADRQAGVDEFLALLDELRDERAELQERRRRTDAEIVELMRDPLRADCDDPAFLASHRTLVRALPGGHRFGGSFRIVVATRDSLAPRMAGPGIRAWNIARELAAEHEVRLVSLTNAQLTDPAFSIEQVDSTDIGDLVEWCDIFFFQGWVMGGQACFEREDRIFVADVYDPMHLEQLEAAKDDGPHNRRVAVLGATEVLNEQLRRGDFFVCASEKQRDFWLGHLASLGRINPVTYDFDPSLRSQIAVVPFGIPDEPPVRTRDAIKGVMDGVGPDDPVILWGGGVYNWFDPLTLIRAVDQLRARIPNVRLVFLGMRHPNVEVPEMRMAVQARRLADELGLTGSTVIFNEEWVAYEDRQNYLLDADVAVTTHLHHIETEFSFRTRVLDYLWAGLPTVATSGDSLADLIEHEGLGLTVAPGDVDGLTEALLRLLEDDTFAADCRANVAEVRARFAWSVALRPIVEFCRRPVRSPDLASGYIDAGGFVSQEHGRESAWIRYRRVVVNLVRDGEWGVIAASAVRVSRRLLGKALGRTPAAAPAASDG
jgi:glycosyltransferase involved in cell wall biosynthesis